MRIIKEQFLQAAAEAYPRGAPALAEWVKKFKAGHWRNPAEMRTAFPSLDPVIVKSGNTVYVFNIRRNEYRLIAAVHFDKQRVLTLRFLTHAEYDRQNWKNEL